MFKINYEETAGKFVNKLVSKLIEKAIYKKFGAKPTIDLLDLNVNGSDSNNIKVSFNASITFDKNDVKRIIEKVK